MLISEKQQEANRQNAQHSTGPTSPAGKDAVRLNALKYGLRARDLIIFDEDPEEYKQLAADLEGDWRPQSRTESLLLEQMTTSQWLLARISRGESRIYQAGIAIEKQFALLRDVAAQRTKLERSFLTAMRELKQLQKERQARQPQPAQTAAVPALKPAEYNPGPWPLSPDPGAQSAFCAPAATDSR
jgi:hypothetical protein